MIIKSTSIKKTIPAPAIITVAVKVALLSGTNSNKIGLTYIPPLYKRLSSIINQNLSNFNEFFTFFKICLSCIKLLDFLNK